ncbi:MAG: copper chaperone PCu(A)C [Alphaproteobacteria bacterium]|jgi:copper(I)-binding protein|nr:copper chaperone PCu(A)C [Alphaproteobacteria bacterium]
MSIRKIISMSSCAMLLTIGSAYADINVIDSYSYETSPGMRVGAAFMTIENTGDQIERIVGATSSVCDQVEIHTMEQGESGVMMMRKVKDGLEIKPGEKLVLSSQGYHLMLVGLHDTLVENKNIDVTLERETGEPIALKIQVFSRAGYKAHTDKKETEKSSAPQE